MIKIEVSNWKIEFSKKQLIYLGLIFLVYFLTRIFNLTKLPVFCDEGIYIRWSQIMRTNANLRFVSLQDGKQPLFMWLTIPFLKIFSDPLFAGRMVSVVSGFFTLIGVFSLPIIISFIKKEKLNNLNLGLIAGFLYLISPFNLFFNRMALVDGLLSAFGIWALNFSLLLGKLKRLDTAMILGMVLGGGLLTKSPAVFFIGLAVVTVLILLIGRDKSRLIPTIILLAISLFIAFMIYNILRLSGQFHMLSMRNQDYIRTYNEIYGDPFKHTFSLFGDISRYYWYYLTPPLVIIGLIGLIKKIYNDKRLVFFILFLWWFGPLVAQALAAKTFTARYILFTVPVFLVFVGYGLSALYRVLRISEKTGTGLRLGLMTLLFFPAIIFNYNLLVSPTKANLPEDERRGYLEDWTAGYGIKEIGEYLKKLPSENEIVVGTEGFFGTLPNGLQIYVNDFKNITVIGTTYPVTEIPKSLEESAQAGNQTFLVVNKSRYKIEGDRSEKLDLIKSYEKPGGDKLLFLEVKN
jgi:4-amino-4-deoxy-L-arabinose transferase-like glycosyltransferase